MQLLDPDDMLALLDEARHLEALTVLSSDWLQRDDAFRAFIFADRRCRIAAPDAHDLLLRGEALRRLGFEAAFEADVRRAFELDPTDVLVNRFVLGSDRPEALAAARWVVSDPRSGRDLRASALDCLSRNGHGMVARLVIESGRLSGWAAWRGAGRHGLRVVTDQETVDVPLHGTLPTPIGAASTARIDQAIEGTFLGATLLRGDDPAPDALVFARLNPAGAAGHHPAPRPADPERPRTTAPAQPPITVIVPVYDDPEITRACLSALAPQSVPGADLRVMVVDDAAPTAAMTSLVAGLCGEHGFDLIVNDRNLGFVGAVNKALDRTPEGDVVFLNSDVILPEGAIARLAAAARTRPGIGIVNPLTNNGQFCSFPAMFGTEPLESEARIAALDSIAARVNQGRLVPVPSGNGFCMYVTRACLEAVGGISEVYLRGYYEDVEFSLRAKQKGFDSVCAPNVYVGHKGSASFKDEKRSLVKRNQRVLRVRFAVHSADTRAFSQADPLREARAAIEDEVAPLDRAEILLVGSASYAALLDGRAEMLRRAGYATLILSWSARQDRIEAALRRGGQARARNKTYRLAATEAQADLLTDLDRVGAERIEVAGPPGPFAATLDALVGRGIGLGYLLGESLGSAAPSTPDCAPGQGAEPCAACVAAFDLQWEPRGVGASLARAIALSDAAPAVIVSTDAIAREVAFDLANDTFGASRFETLPVEPAEVRHFARERVQASGRPPALGLLYADPDLATERFVAELAAQARATGSAWTFILIGQALNDRRLLLVGNLFVTGPATEDDYPDMLDHYGVAALFAPQRWAGYGMLDRLATGCGAPKAYFDWSIGAVPGRPGDLSLDPRMCDRRAAAGVCGWLDAQLAEAGL